MAKRKAEGVAALAGYSSGSEEECCMAPRVRPALEVEGIIEKS